MAQSDIPPSSADAGLGKVDRGQRVISETEMGECHDGKERAHFARPMRGRLPADTHGAGATPSPITVEDVVEVAETASAWEAVEEEPEAAAAEAGALAARVAETRRSVS